MVFAAAAEKKMFPEFFVCLVPVALCVEASADARF